MNETENHNITNIETNNTEMSNINNTAINNISTNNTKTKQCKKCKEQINKGAKVCPHCRAKQGLPVWLIVIIVIMVLGIISGGGEEENNVDNNNSSKPTETIDYIKVSKDDMDEALENNAAAARDTYYKKYVEVTGKLGTIDSELTYISLMSLTNEWDFNGIYCKVKNSEQKQIIKTLSKDQEITIRGKITDVGEVLGYYMDIIEIIIE